MIPPLIIQEALDKHIEIIAITDHNSIDNIPAVIEAAQGTGIKVLSGIELQTREEIHSLCLFDRFEQVQEFFFSIQDSFPKIANNPDFFGEQFVVDASGEFVRREDRLLITSSSMSLKSAWEQVDRLNGLMIPAHVNRSAFGLLPVLGFIPQDIPLEVFEISRHITPEAAVAKYPGLANYHLIQSGDAHLLSEILGMNELLIEKRTVNEIRGALMSQNGRSARIINH
ncbi:MAG: PHP domain-containing protein [Chloroflexi bacterium]|nr:PHP domain-containing protein [Chloroflexota bacterium]